MRRLILVALLLCALPVGAQDFIRYYPPAGAAGLTSSGTAITSTVPILFPNGSATAPSIAFATDSGAHGFYRLTNSALAWASLGAARGTLGYNAITVSAADGSIKFGATNDVVIGRDGANNTVKQGDGTYDSFWRHYGLNGGYWERGVHSELLTIAAAATTDSVGDLLPANAIIESVVMRVVTVIPTAATFTVGDATTAARFSTGVAVAAGTVSVGLLHRNPDVAAAAGPVQTAAAKVRITPDSSPGAATGQVRIEVFFSRFVAPTT